MLLLKPEEFKICLFTSIAVINAKMNLKNWFSILLKRLHAPNAKVKKSAGRCLPSPFPAVASLRARPALPVEHAQPPVVQPATNKLKSLFELI
jgi:hypothetical protein